MTNEAFWYRIKDSKALFRFHQISIKEFDLKTVSFTYGDSMPTFSPTIHEEKEYRHRLYTDEEILPIIEKHGPERYIEVHVWSDETIRNYRLQK